MRKSKDEAASLARRKLRAKIVAVSALTEDDKARMFELMRAYYDDVSREQFFADLAGKDDVILLLDGDGGKIQGFSTLVTVTVNQDNREYRGVFSGDTVLEKAYWGQRALGKAFLRYLFVKKLQRPIKPLYWLLISKGYKTYLMMANNFAEYYPRYDAPMPADKRALMDAFYSRLYPRQYDAGRGLIVPADEACHLRAGVAAISQRLLEENPKVAFFQEANPDWGVGVELACLARMPLWMPLRYALKAVVIDRVWKPLQSFQFSVFSFQLKKEKKTDE